jgi:radical SAM superfamily enzyme YgiQ (UPF0313 family)/transcription elongation factor Elf1
MTSTGDKRTWLLILAPGTGNINVFSLGLGYISAALKAAGYKVACLDLTFVPLDQEEALIESMLRESNAGIVGMGGLSRDWIRMRSAMDVVRRVRPDTIAVLGGGGVSSDPEMMVETLDADFGVLGEGEDTVVELAEALAGNLPVDGILGIVYRDAQGALRRTLERRGTRDLDALPMPDFEGFSLREYLDRQSTCSAGVYDSFHDAPRIMPIVLSRSCPFPCTFCYHAVAKYRTRSLDTIFEEVNYLIENYAINILAINDDLFAVKRERVAEFCNRIKEIGILWNCQLRVDVVDEELLAMMRDAGCYQISYGFESISDTILESMKKKVKRQDIIRAADITYAANIDIQANLIFGDFAENYDTINETMTWWYDNWRYRVWIVRLDTYPGAQIYHRAMQEGLITDGAEFLRQQCPHVNLTKIPDPELTFFLDAVDTANLVIRLPAPILEAKLVNSGGNTRLSVVAKCPHCHGHVSWSSLPASNSKVICKACRGRFEISITSLVGRHQIPDDVTAVTKTALDLIHAGRSREAIRVAAASVGHGDQDAYHALGVALLLTGSEITVSDNQQASAIHILRRAASMNPDSAPVQANLAAAYLAAGWVGFGLLHARQAQLLDPGLEENNANFVLAQSLAREDEELIRFMPAMAPLPLNALRVVMPTLSTAGNIRTYGPLKDIS